MDRDLRDPRHPDEVVGTREERAKGRGEGNVLAHREPARRTEHQLLGYEGFEISLWRDLLERLGVRRVANLGIQHDDLGAS